MRIASGGSSHPEAGAAVRQAWRQLDEAGITPQLLLCHASASYPAEHIRRELVARAGAACTIAGASSCLGAMNERGMWSSAGRGLSLIAFAQDEPAFGAGLVVLGDDAQAAAAEAVQRAIEDAGRPGELPDLVLLSAAPGREEAVLQGIASVIGPNVPVFGGSSADNDIAGDWWQLTRTHSEQDGVLVVALYPDCAFATAFQSGYAPTAHSGVVTSADGRSIHSIDGEPAAIVYNRWTDGLIADWRGGGNILAPSTFRPLGREVGRIQGVPCFTLLHPERVCTDGTLRLFADAREGERLTLMEGSTEGLVARAGSVAAHVIEREQWRAEQVAGALVVYCAGCMLGVQDRLDDVHRGLRRALGGRPFQVLFSFGEQGCFIDGRTHHANLMISAIVFADTEAV